MQRAIVGLAVFLATGTAAAAEKAEQAKSNMLTPKEAAEGWLLLFDGETTFGWKARGEVKVADGMLTLVGGEKAAAVTSTSEIGEFELRFEYRIEVGLGSTGRLHWQKVPENGPAPAGADVAVGLVRQRGDGEKEVSAWGQGVVRVAGQKVNYEVAHVGDSGREQGLSLPIKRGAERNTLEIRAYPGKKLSFRNIKLKPLGLEPIFNGKDLTGWKQFLADPKRAKSKFTVTKEGWLNVKNGPGDLQTERQYDDFLLQLECISNGKFLNSGIFFRCIPGQYQNGYEAQIQNGWLGDRTKPIDFGTGAIYRRQPARKVVSNDHEWFTMTVLAHGNHMATWVNGYQVTDFTDTRKPNENARNGSKVGKGAISIQGHDPTTDLSFRNFRIAELPKDKKE